MKKVGNTSEKLLGIRFYVFPKKLDLEETLGELLEMITRLHAKGP
jgi:hypothetical protein